MNRTNLIKTINKISDYVNEILDVNKNNENLLLNSNNPSFYVMNNRNLLKSIDDFKTNEFTAEIWAYRAFSDKNLENVFKDGKSYTIFFDLTSINKNTGGEVKYPQYGISLYDFDKRETVGISIINDIDFPENEEKSISLYVNRENYPDNLGILFYTGVNTTDGNDRIPQVSRFRNMRIFEVYDEGSYTPAPEDKVNSKYPYSEMDEYNKDFYNKENIKDVHIKENDIYLDFKVDETLLERNERYTFSFYARNKSKEDVYFINEDLDMKFLIKKDEFKSYVDYIFIDEDMNINDLLSRSKFIQETNETNEKDINLDLFGFKLEKGLNKTEYLPNINDIEGGDLLSNIFNIDSKDNSNLLNLNEDFNINMNSKEEDYIDFNSIDKYNLDNDEFYTLSMDVKVEEMNDLSTKSLYSGFIDKDGNYTSAKNVYYLPLDNNKINKTFRAYFIYYLRDIENIKSFVVRAGYSKEQSSKNDMSFSKFKLEKGKISTPYSKAVNTVENIIIDPEI
ncbi:hypothetical protein CPT_Machias_209 [Staphylococcus phage Machias]|nr:hypothetical protein CPT_Machias_209 [Staphylococcus phage Machias]